MCNICDGHMSVEKINEIKLFFRGRVNDTVKELREKEMMKRKDQGAGLDSSEVIAKIVSSNPRCSKRKITHGQKGARRKRVQGRS